MYIRDCPSAVTMGEYLYQKEGYRMEKEVGPEDDEYPENDIMKVMTFASTTRHFLIRFKIGQTFADRIARL